MAEIIFSLLSAPVSYAVGRIGHVFGGDINGPHHWIYGAVLIIAGASFWYDFWGLLAIFSGGGLFISDFKDFWDLKFYGIDEPGPKRFWGID